MSLVFYLSMSLLFFSMVGYWVGTARAIRIAQFGGKLRALPRYYGALTGLCVFIPGLVWLFLAFLLAQYLLEANLSAMLGDYISNSSPLQTEQFFRNVSALSAGEKVSEENELLIEAAQRHASRRHHIQIFITIGTVAFYLFCFIFAWRLIKPVLNARVWIETLIRGFLVCSSAVAVLTTFSIFLSLIVESWRFFGFVPLSEFLFGLHWSPQMVGENGSPNIILPQAFGIVPLLMGTLLITLIAMFVAAPIGLLSAIYLSEYASSFCRSIVKPLLEILAGIPTVVYGFFAALTVGPLIYKAASIFDFPASAESALAAGLMMGVMIVPFVSSLSDDVISAVPQSLRDGSAALGATKSETVIKVVMPAALPGVISALLLGVSRAIGETMIVVMAAGLAAKLTLNPLESVTTVTVQIVTLLSGDQEFDNPKTLAAFALSLALFLITLLLNIIALRVVRKYRQQYE